MVFIAVVAGGFGSYRAGQRAEQLARPRPVMVQVTPHGKRYHLPGGQYLRNGSVSVPLTEARTRYRACLGCRPPL
jgi:hypothetical protein